MSAHIIGLEKPALFLYHVDGLGMILHIQPVTYVLPSPYTGSFFPWRALLMIRGISFSGNW